MLDLTRPSAEPLFAVHDASCGTTRTVVAAGELDLSVAARFDAAVTSALESGAETVVVDLADLTFIDSSGVHVLLRAHRRALGGTVRLIILPAADNVQHVFEMCGLHTVLPFGEDPSA
jgi:anti-sigma B factor antagonist